MSDTDNVSVADQVFADLLKNDVVQATAPLFPCPKCGRETKSHHTPAGSRICSSRECRYVVEDPAEIEASRRAGEAVRVEVIPCAVCGKPTKAHHEGKRICSDKGCRNVQD